MALLAERHPLQAKNFHQNTSNVEKNQNPSIFNNDQPWTFEERIEREIHWSQKGLMTLGYGVNAFFKFNVYMIILMSILTLLSIPSIIYFFSHNHSDQFFWKLELGNLGFATSLCQDTPLGVGKVSLDCPAGIIAEIIDFGLIPHNAKIMDTCVQNNETKKCDSVFDWEFVRQKLIDTCFEKEDCSFDVNEFVKTGHKACISDFSWFFI